MSREPTVADLLAEYRRRTAPPAPPPSEPGPSLDLMGPKLLGICLHRRHWKWVGRYKHLQSVRKTRECVDPFEAAYLRDCLAWGLTGGTIAAKNLNFPHLFPEAGSC